MSGLSNAEFRVIMMTPRGGSAPAFPSSSSGSMQPPAKSAKTKKKKKQNVNPKQQMEEILQKYETEDKENVDGKYRDRSKERREGKGLDDENMEDLQTLGIEESKFLGGDMEHTHLVKGLDYALLERVKAEISSKQSEILDEQEEEHAPVQQESRKQNFSEENFEFSCNSVLARKIYNQLTSVPPSATTTEKFLPGRTTFVFDLTSTNTSSDLPTTYFRSKEDCPPVANTKTYQCEGQIFQKISTIMSYLRSGKQSAKKKEDASQPLPNNQTNDISRSQDLPAAAIQEVSQAHNTEDDIFPDVGEYIPDIPVPKKQKENTRGLSSTSYFESTTKDSEPMQVEDEVFVPKTLLNQIDTMLKKQQNEGKPANTAESNDTQSQISDLIEDQTIESTDHKRPSKRDPRELDPSFISDNYVECYPATYEISYAMYDEGSDEEDLSKMDTGKKHKLTRASFTSEEAWSAYNNNREQLPKAAFQFGVKTADGRKTRKNKKDKDRKLDSQLKKINEKIKDRENIRSAPVPTAQEVSKKMKYNT